MSANQSDDARQRLNYFNGERLTAADFRAEQGYHLGMRRVLNHSLYSPGIVVGLEVEPVHSTPPDPLDKHRVVVRRGLAFDHLGREIFVPADVNVQVMGARAAHRVWCSATCSSFRIARPGSFRRRTVA